MDEPEEILFRFDTSRESAARLARKAAESATKTSIHGISVSATVTDIPSSMARRADVEVFFRVCNTPTDSDPMHRTVELPQPVTREVARQFNKLFGRGG